MTTTTTTLTAAEEIHALARTHSVTYTRSALDDFGDTITRLSGDDVELDETEWLLVALERADQIEGVQATLLHARYLRERDQKPRRAAVVFDPFGDFATRGYLRNHAGETDLDIVKQLEHRSFQAGLARAMNDIAKGEPVAYADVLATHKTLFSRIYPWAGTDRMRNATDIAITRPAIPIFSRIPCIPQVLGWALSKGTDQDFMRERPGSVMGALAHAHPFLDGNGRTIRVVHHELAARAGIAIAWDQTNKADYLQALTEELQQPEARRLDFYLKPFIREAVERQSATRPC